MTYPLQGVLACTHDTIYSLHKFPAAQYTSSEGQLTLSEEETGTDGVVLGVVGESKEVGLTACWLGV